MAELFGALLITFFLTRAIYIGLSIAKKRINPIKAALIAFFLVAAIALLVSSFTMGIGKGFILYIPCLVLWLIIDIVRAKKNPESKNKQEVNMPKEEKFCMNCGAKIPADAEICPVCGTKQSSLDVRLGKDTRHYEREMNKNNWFAMFGIKNINEKQKAILVVGIIIIILMGLFPPWVYTSHYGTTYSEYSFIATQPEHRRSIVKLDSSRLVLQWIVVLIAMGLGIFLTSTQNKEPRNKEPQNKEPDETNKLRE